MAGPRLARHMPGQPSVALFQLPGDPQTKRIRGEAPLWRTEFWLSAPQTAYNQMELAAGPDEWGHVGRKASPLLLTRAPLLFTGFPQSAINATNPINRLLMRQRRTPAQGVRLCLCGWRFSGDGNLHQSKRRIVSGVLHHPYFIAANTFSGRAGRLRTRAPVALAMALITATWVEVNGSSPTPAAPKGPSGRGVSM
jgi:hypothetical protein